MKEVENTKLNTLVQDTKTESDSEKKIKSIVREQLSVKMSDYMLF